jgi:hypothetical protein
MDGPFVYAVPMQHRLTRRGLFITCAAMMASGSAAAERKASKSEAGYQSKSKSVYSCADCTFFRAPVSCARVQGAVNANGWCKFYLFPD